MIDKNAEFVSYFIVLPIVFILIFFLSDEVFRSVSDEKKKKKVKFVKTILAASAKRTNLTAILNMSKGNNSD